MTPLFRTLADYLTLDPGLTTTWWVATTRARWSTVQAWRCAVCYFDDQPASPQKLDTLRGLLETVAAPARLVEVLEALHQEGQLRRKDATQIQDKVLALLDCQGRWL